MSNIQRKYRNYLTVMSFGYKSEEESYQLTMLSEPFININSFNRLQREKKNVLHWNREKPSIHQCYMFHGKSIFEFWSSKCLQQKLYI